MNERVGQELELIRTGYPEAEYREVLGIHWVRIPEYPVPEGWTHDQVEVAFQIPASAGTAPYAFRVRPHLGLKDGRMPINYTFPVETPWGIDWGQFSWSPEGWVPKESIRAGANMLNFARSFAVRFEERV